MEINDLLKILITQTETLSIEIEKAVNLFININTKYKRQDTITYYKDHLKPFLEFCTIKKIIETNKITNIILDDYIIFLKMKNNLNQTINKRIALIQNMFNFLSSMGYISKTSFSIKKLEASKKEITILKEIDLIKVLDFLKTKTIKTKLILLLLLSTGIRRTELTYLKLENINLSENKIFLSITKSKKTRYIYLVKNVKNILEIYLNEITNKVYLFEDRTNQKMNSKSITYILWYISKQLKIEHFSPHQLRHTYATHLLKNGADIEETRRLLGHSDLRMTTNYLHYLDKDLAKANTKYNILNNLDKKKKI